MKEPTWRVTFTDGEATDASRVYSHVKDPEVKRVAGTNIVVVRLKAPTLVAAIEFATTMGVA